MVSGKRAALLAISIIVLTGLALISGLAFGFFVIPVVLAVVCWAIFYWALRYQGVRNPLSPSDPSTADRWADGQPYNRSREHALAMQALREEEKEDARAVDEKRERYAVEREEASSRTHPSDFQGPPPVNPFP